MTEKNEIKDIVAELVQVRSAIASLNPDPTITIAAYQAEKETALAATKNLAASTACLMWATWALVGVTILLALAALGPMAAMFRGHRTTGCSTSGAAAPWAHTRPWRTARGQVSDSR